MGGSRSHGLSWLCGFINEVQNKFYKDIESIALSHTHDVAIVKEPPNYQPK